MNFLSIMNEILITEKSESYELIDSGNGEKLERFGDRILRRPDPQAIWSKSLNDDVWSKAQAVYERSGERGKWKTDLDPEWSFSFQGINFSLKLLPSKHVGVFPEQSQNWKWLEDKIKTRKLKLEGEKIQVLNLFGYTGGATIACARAGALVCHVDASKFVVDYANKNLKDSGLGEKEVRFIVDDVRKFVEREIKRGNKYDLIVLDPPVYGKGTNDKEWNLDVDLPKLLFRLKSVLSDNAIGILLNGYSSIYSHITYKQLLQEVFKDGVFSSGEIVIKDSSGKFLPSGIFARWEK